jgi:hypothetical protein
LLAGGERIAVWLWPYFQFFSQIRKFAQDETPHPVKFRCFDNQIDSIVELGSGDP